MKEYTITVTSGNNKDLDNKLAIPEVTKTTSFMQVQSLTSFLVSLGAKYEITEKEI